MPLSDDQKAMLRLLAQREEGYEDIAALLGLSVAQVRERVKEALAELDSGAAPSTSPPRTPEPPPGPAAVAPEPELPPAPAPPSPPPAPRKEPEAAAPQPRATAARRRIALPRDRRRLIELAGGALVAILLVLFATGAVDLGGGDSEGDSNSSGSTTELPAPNGQQATQAVLRGVDGSDAAGQALFGRLRKQVILVLGAEGLAPTPQGQAYALSLARSSNDRIPIVAFRVDKSGRVAEQFKVPPSTLGLLAAGYDEMEVSLVVNSTLRKALTRAAGKRPPVFQSTAVMRGEVTGPIVAAGREAEGG